MLLWIIGFQIIVCSYSTCFFFLGPIILFICFNLLFSHFLASSHCTLGLEWGWKSDKKKNMSFLFVLFGGDHHFQELMVENGCGLQDLILNAGRNITSVQKEKI